jgi:rubredoxin
MADQLHLPEAASTPGALADEGHDEVLNGLSKGVKETDAERAAYRQRLRQALQDPAFRAIEGFPKGSDEAILALSDPPYYTACPNPFLPEILERWGAERAQLRASLGLPDDREEDGDHGRGEASPGPYDRREPFAADVSEGKNDPIYNAHSYHTKVPHKAIMRYILHYTDPGDIVFDGFCGTGMTGVAASLCGDRKAVESLGYTVAGDGWIYEGYSTDYLKESRKLRGQKPISRLGARRAVLVDLCPAATFIAYNYNTPVDAAAFEREARRILRDVEAECGWMYETWHPHVSHPGRVKGRINYTVWSDVFVCPACGGELVFWEAAVDQAAGAVRERFPCPHCGALQTKRSLERAWETAYDRALGRALRRAKQVPVLINYTVGRKRYDKRPDADDLALIQRIEESDIPYWFPTDRMPEGYNTEQPKVSHGITHVHHFYTRRNLWALAALWNRVRNNLKVMWVMTGIALSLHFTNLK